MFKRKCRKYNFLVFATIFLVSGCQKVDLNEINNLNGNQISIIGHGGIGFESLQNPLPHNSYSSVVKAVEAYGVEGVEVDIQLSSDGVLFMYHDNTLESLTDCAGCVLFNASEVLKNCRYRSSIRSNLFLNETLSPIEDIFKKFVEWPVQPILILDIKEAMPTCGAFVFEDYVQKIVDEIARLIIKYNALDWIIVEAEKMVFLRALQEKLPTIRLSFIPNYHLEEEVVDAAENGIYLISCRNDLITKEFSNFIHANGLRVAIYSVRTREGTIRAINKSPDFIYTDNIILLQEILK